MVSVRFMPFYIQLRSIYVHFRLNLIEFETFSSSSSSTCEKLVTATNGWLKSEPSIPHKRRNFRSPIPLFVVSRIHTLEFFVPMMTSTTSATPGMCCLYLESRIQSCNLKNSAILYTSGILFPISELRSFRNTTCTPRQSSIGNFLLINNLQLFPSTLCHDPSSS